MKNKILFIVLTLFFACQNENKIHKNIISPRGFDNITLIFENAPEYRKPSLKGLIRGSERKSYYYEAIAQYLDDDGIIKRINPLRKPNNDTIVISLNKKRLEIHFTEYERDGALFLFSAGDTARITYKGDFVSVDILNRKVKPFDFSLNILGTSEKDSISPFELFFSTTPSFKVDYGMSWTQYMNEVYLPKQAVVLEDYLLRQDNLLDSLFKNELLSNDVYLYNKSKVKYTYWSMRAKLKDLPGSQATTLDQGDKFKNIEQVFSTSKTKKNFNLKDLTMAGDSLLSYQHYQSFLLFHYLPFNVDNKTSLTTFKYENFGGRNFDWLALYDSLDNSDLYSEKIKAHLKYRYIKKIVSALSPETIDKYYTKFKKIPNTEQFQSILNEALNFDQFAPNNLELMDAANTKTNIDSLLAANQGKVILLNFWASWCKPCLDAIPVFKELISDYKNDPFVFISISIEKDFDQWISSEGLKLKQDESYNYIIQDYYSSNYMKKHHIMYMPRYILYGKDGEIIDSNAPSPEKERLRELIEESLGATK